MFANDLEISLTSLGPHTSGCFLIPSIDRLGRTESVRNSGPSLFLFLSSFIFYCILLTKPSLGLDIYLTFSIYFFIISPFTEREIMVNIYVKISLQSMEALIMPVINHIREIRKQKNISQIQMAEDLQVTRQTINAIEKNKYNPSLELALKIIAYFELPLEDIFQLKEEE